MSDRGASSFLSVGFVWHLCLPELLKRFLAPYLINLLQTRLCSLVKATLISPISSREMGPLGY